MMRRTKISFETPRRFFCQKKEEEEEKKDLLDRVKRLGPFAVGGAYFLSKAKFAVGALKLSKFSTLISMGASVGAYTMFYGFPFAIGMVGLIFVHESGHALAMRYYGIPFSPMVFVPFMGAVIAQKEHTRTVYEEAVIAISGPLLGTLGAFGVGALGHLNGSPLLIQLCDFGIMINMFNMLPIGSMDGGRIANAISKHILLGGLGIGAVLIVQGVVNNPLFYLIVGGSAISTYQRFFGQGDSDLPPSYHDITFGQRATLGSGYVGLIALMLMGMYANKSRKVAPEDLEMYHKDPISYELYRLYRSGNGLQSAESLITGLLERDLKDVSDLRERSTLRFSKIRELEQNFKQVVRERETGEQIYDSNFDMEIDILFSNLREYCYIREMEEESNARRVG